MKIPVLAVAALLCCSALRAGILTAGGPLFDSYVEGSASPGQLATFTDSDPNEPLSNLSSIINWGDGTASTGTITSGGAGLWMVSGTHAYAEEGTYSQTITASNIGSQATVLNTATVADAPLTAATSGALSGTEGASFSGVVGTFSDANPAASASDFNATINWGDNTAGPATVLSIGSGQFQVTGTHVYARQGSYNVTAGVVDLGGSTIIITGTATISDAPLNASSFGSLSGLTAGATFSRTLVSFVDANRVALVSDFVAIIDWGDGTPNTSGTIAALPSGQFTVSGVHDYLNPGTYSAQVSIFDSGGSNVSTTDAAFVVAAPEPAFTLGVAAALALFVIRRRYRVSA